MVTYVPLPAVVADTRTVNPFSAMKVAPDARPDYPWSDEVRRARNPAELVQVIMPLLIREGDPAKADSSLRCWELETVPMTAT